MRAAMEADSMRQVVERAAPERAATAAARAGRAALLTTVDGE